MGYRTDRGVATKLNRLNLFRSHEMANADTCCRDELNPTLAVDDRITCSLGPHAPTPRQGEYTEPTPAD